MFKFLKNKIKDAVNKFAKSAEEDVKEKEQIIEQQEEIKQQKEQPLETINTTTTTETQDVIKEVKENVVSESTVVSTKSTTQEPPLQKEPAFPPTNKPDVPQIKEPLELEETKERKHEEEIIGKIKQDGPVDLVTNQALDVKEADEYEETGKKKGFLGKLFGKKEYKEEHEEELKSVFESEPLVDSEPILVSKPAPVSEPEPAIEKKEVATDVQQEPKTTKSAPVSESASQEKKMVRSELLEDSIDATKQKKGFFGKLKERVVKFQLTDEKFEELFWEFELALLENNVAVEVIEKIKKDLHIQLTQENVTRKSVEEVITETLKKSLSEILDVPTFNLLEKIKTKKPYVICMIGVNGSGKTTTLAKLIHYFKKNNLSVVVAAADTFRAAAIQQLEEHTTKLGVKLIKHDYNADPAAVAFDAIKHATAKGLDVVLIDTAGRLQSNNNLMDELKKLIRVNKPDMNIFVGESITGNDCVEQAVAFNEAVGIDGIILSKTDVDDKGGAAISVSYVTGKPILYLGTGQTYDDLEPFDKEKILTNLGL